MPRKLHIGVRPKWTGTPAPLFSTGASSSLNLASSVTNPRNYALTYSVASGSLPAGATLSGSSVQWDGRIAAASSSPVVFRFTSSFGTTDSATATVTVQERHAKVDWTAPTTNSAGQTFDGLSNNTTLAGYRIYYGTDSATVLAGTSSSQLVAAGTTTYTFTGLALGTWHFRVVAYDGDNDESNTGASATTYSKVIS